MCGGPMIMNCRRVAEFVVGNQTGIMGSQKIISDNDDDFS